VTAQPLILSIETATLAGSLCISKGREVLAASSGDSTVSHSNTLLADVDKLLSKTDLTVGDIDLFAVASGPGSFTGLRIGIATIKALATTLGRPCVGIPTLEAIAHAAGTTVATVVLLPAGRGEVFCQMFSSVDAQLTAIDEPAHLSPAKMIERYGHLDDVVWTGEAAKLYSNLILECVSPKPIRIIEPPANLAEHVSALALTKLASEAHYSPNNLHAIYVRPSDAELKV
jgi:tRNA threonylcarbamoyladenosine biosynthesis protein TsaB